MIVYIINFFLINVCIGTTEDIIKYVKLGYAINSKNRLDTNVNSYLDNIFYKYRLCAH